MFHGSMVALVTPMDENGAIDFAALDRLIEFHLNEGTDAIIVVGTTGESATLSAKEHQDLIKYVIKKVAGRLPVIAGTGDNSTQRTIEATRHAMELGADASLIVTPYYNKPSQEGLYQHYKAIAKAVPMPIILYNVPGRTACDMCADTVAKLAELTNVVGIKEASGNANRTKEILDLADGKIDVYSGEDALAYDVMALGGKGVISVTANVAPRLMQQMCSAILNDDLTTAKELNSKLMPLHKSLFLQSNPIPVKWALYKMGMIPKGIRLPLTILAKEFHQPVLDALRQLEIYK